MARRVLRSAPPPVPRPYTVLKKPRVVRPELRFPSDLAVFYSRHEGVGLSAPGRYAIPLASLAELKRIGPADVDAFAGGAPAEWAKLEAIRLSQVAGIQIVYIVSAPCFRFGSVVALGQSVPGPIQSPTGQPAFSLVLDASFGGWVARLDRHEWVERGLTPNGVAKLQKGEAESLLRHYRNLNLGLVW